MHTFTGRDGAVFHYNSDASGPIVVANGLGEETRVTYSDLCAFMAKLKSQKPKQDYAPSPTAAPQFAERLKALPLAKDSVSRSIEFLRAKLERETNLTPWERQMFDVAINSVKGAR